MTWNLEEFIPRSQARQRPQPRFIPYELKSPHAIKEWGRRAQDNRRKTDAYNWIVETTNAVDEL